MKTTKLLLGIAAFALIGATIFTGCKGKDGVDGAAGPQGPIGLTGPQGENASEYCVACHTTALQEQIVVFQAQWGASLHGMGTSWGYAGSRKDCAPCHSSQGYQEVCATGADTVTAAPADPYSVNCETCHEEHASIATAGGTTPTLLASALTPYKFVLNGLTSPWTNSTNNLCGRCHQSRSISPFPTDLTNNTDVVEITSQRFGPHHSAASIILAGKGFTGLEIAGTATYDNSKHTINNVTCTDCHMGPNGTLHETVGQHTWLPSLVSCNNCHGTTASSYDIDGKQTEIQGLLDQLRADINTKYTGGTGKVIADPDATTGECYIWGNNFTSNANSSTNKLTLTSAKVACILVFQMVNNDHSKGMHNYKYSKALLQNAIAKVATF